VTKDIIICYVTRFINELFYRLTVNSGQAHLKYQQELKLLAGKMMRKLKSYRSSLITTTLVSLISSSSWGQAPKTDAFLQAKLTQSSGWASVIVRSPQGVSTTEEAQLKALGADIYRHLPLVHSVALRIPARRLTALSALAFVERLSSDLTVKKTDEFTVGHSGANVAWSYGFKGTGVGVAVLDSGVAPFHPDLLDSSYKSRIVSSPDFAGEDKFGDPCGHGSHVAGIIAGDGSASSGSKATRTFYGVAPDAKIINVRILDHNGEGKVSNAIAAIQWVIANKDLNGNNIRVLNLSLGHEVGESYKTDPLCQAVEAAWKAGIVVVCAAGNDGRLNAAGKLGQPNEGYGNNYGSITSPGNDPYVITVGAVKNNFNNRLLDQIATYSSRGPSRIDNVMKPDLVAPGNRVVSLNSALGYNTLSQAYATTNALPWTSYLTTGSSGDSMLYFYLSGTSMAAPVVAGAAALLLQKDPTLTPDTVKARLMFSADKLWSDPCTYGAGLLNIPAALGQSVKPTVAALSPALLKSGTSGIMLLDPNRAVWGAVGSTRAIWGVQSVTNYQAIWGNMAIWGVQAIWGNQAIWGWTVNSTQAVWGNKAVWGNMAIWGTNSTAVDLSSTTIFGEN
jgi:serine protease AprX